LKRIERIIFRDINNNVTQVNTLANQVETNKKIVRLQERKLKAEEVKLQYGRSSSDIIIRFQEDLLNARLNLARALFSYRIALINLERNKNTLLSKYWKGKL
jgi:outer membrane protein TolC